MSSTAIDRVIYTGRVHTTGGRDGGARSDDGRLDVKLTPPGAAGTGTNPEQLLAAGWSGCYLSALRIEAGRMKMKLPAETSVDIEVDLAVAGDGYVLRARLIVGAPGADPEVVRRVAEVAHGVCPYSKALHGRIEVSTDVRTGVAASGV